MATITEFNEAIGAVCDMVTIADLESMRKTGKGYNLVTKVCDQTGNTTNSYEIIMKYYEEEDGTKHIVAEVFGNIVSDVVFENEMDKALKKAAIAAAAVAVADSPAPGPSDLAAVAVFLSMASKGYAVSKAKSFASGEVVKNSILSVWPDNTELQSLKENKIVFTATNNVVILEEQDEELQKSLVEAVYQKDKKEVKIGDTLYDIKNGKTNLEVRNAIDYIPDVSVLLSHILIKSGEEIDLGAQGTYKVSSGNTLSEIANSRGMTTRELLALNTWLIDLGRVSFDQDKVLIETDASDLGKRNHTLKGTGSKDILKDYNGGDDTLIGNGGDDYLDGGEGADTLKGGAGDDTYIANDGDIIRDSDHTGKVKFNDKTLAGGEWDTDKELYIDKNNSNITYNLQDSTLTVSNGNESITINDYDKEKESLGIVLEKSIDIEVSISDVTVNEQDGIATLTVSIDEKLDEDLTLQINTSNGSASSEDYVALSQHELIIKAGEKEATLEVEISDDEKKEETENFTVNATGYDYEGEDLNDIDYGQGSTVTIEDDDEAVKVSIENTFAYEGDTAGQFIHIRVNLSKAIDDKSITISTNLGDAVIDAGLTEGTIRYEWTGNKTKDGDKNKTINITNSSQLKENNVEIGSVGSLTIKDDDDCDNPKDCDPDPKDPLVLDINKDGFISTISLEDSNTYFDLTGDGEKEKVGWIGGEDALLVYDENENGQIDGINEVFGNDKLSGFTELKNKIDNNYDGKIDRQDELFYQLQTWHDYDGDGNTDEGELKSLKEAGVVSINTEVFNTNIEVDGNILTEASRYTDSEGNLELAADLLLQYEGSIFENIDETSLGIEVKEEAKNLPSLKAGGYVLDSLYAYSVDEKLLTMAQEFSSDIGKIANNFDEFLSQWSGFYDMAGNRGIQKENFTVNAERNLPLKLWVLEKFRGFRRDSWRSEVHLGDNLYGRYHNQPFGNPNVVQDNYSKLINKYESLFAIQTIYKDIFIDTIEQNQRFDYLVIDNPKVLIHRISKYINDSSIDFDKRLYLASILKKQENWASSDGLGLNFEAIESKITDTYVKNIVSKILNDEVNLLIKTDETTFFENDALIVGTNEDELIETTKNFSYQNGKATIIAGLGYDRIITAKGETKYIYNMGDGVDIIYDKGGNDTLQFNGINEEDIEIQKSNSDLIIGIKETGVAFSELSNKIVIKDFMKIENKIENIVFQDGSSLNIELALQGLLTSEYSDYIDLSNSTSSLNIDSRAGNDTILTGNNDDILTGNLGDDTLQGGRGNDNYIFNIGDGKDIILDTNGIDIISFGENITSNDLIVKVIDSDILIALKEDGIVFDNLSDKITVSNIDKTTVKTIKFNDETSLNIESFQEITSENNNLYFTEKDISLDALEGDDIITTSDGKDSIIGNAGNDIIFTGTNDDTLEGGLGNDNLQGGLGNDTYIFNIGDGKDIIDDSYRYGYKNWYSKNAGNDTLLLGEGITKDNLEVKLNGKDITLAIKENGKTFEEYSDSITIKNWLDTNSKIENILLSDGTNIVLKELQNITEGDDTLVYDNSDVIVDSLGGNDTVITGSGNDIIIAGEGNDNVISGDGFDSITAGDGIDIIDSGKGNDIIDSGKGNDTLQGALGDDTYIFNLGDGVDTIHDYYRYGSAGNDTIKFGENITLDNLSAIANGNDLTISYSDTDKVIVKDYFNTNYKIENILLYDETFLSLEQIQKATVFDDTLIFDNTNVTIDLLDGNDSITTGNGDDIVHGNSGDDIIKTNSGIDSVSGGLGSDTIYSGDGNDTIQGNEGNDNLQGGLGNDTYIFNVGDGTDTIYDDYRYRNKQKFAGTDTIQFGESINQDSLVAQGSGNDLIIAIKELGKSFDELIDKVIIKNWANVNNRIENIKLLDGSLVALESIQIGTLEDDYLLYGDEGITSKGLEGNDIIISGNGDDTITGGLGTDILKAGLGNDIYFFNKGDGEDSISDIGGRDTVKFGENIVKDDLIIKREDDDLIIAINEANISYENLADKIIIKDWFILTNNIETIEFFDGTILSSAEIADYFVEDKLSGFLYSKIGATLIGETGDDTYVYNKGDFTVIIDDSKKESDIDVQAGYDKLILNGGINKEDVTIGVSNDNLIINISTDTTYEELMDRIVVRNWQDENKGIEEIIFSDGEVIQINKDDIFPELNYNEEWNTNNSYILGEEDNHYTGTSEEEIIYAGKGNDNLDSELGDDTLIGEQGNDLLEAGAGNDIYVFNKGDGKDTIYDHYFDSRKGIEVDAGNDTLLFKSGITLNDLIIKQNNNDLIIGIKEDSKTFGELSDKIVIKNWNNVDTKIETIEFNDGSKISKEEILSMMVADGDDIINTPGYSDQLIYGKEGNDVISTNAGNDTIYSGQGDDIVNIAAGNNIVYGGSGVDSITTGHGIDIIEGGTDNDTINSGYGNDILIGGDGNDTLIGGYGNDTYIYKKGNGFDTISEIGGIDKLLFGVNITVDDLIIEKEEKDLIILINETGIDYENLTDKIVIKKWFNSSNNIESFEFEDGTILNSTEIASPFYTGSSDTITSKQYANLNGENGNDTYIYNKGDLTVIIDDSKKESDIDIKAGYDKLILSGGINREDITIGVNGTNLIINIKNENITSDALKDRVVIENWQDENKGIEEIIFSDGEILYINKDETFPGVNYSSSWITQKHYIYGEEDNSINLFVGDSTIESKGGDDTIKSGRYNSILDGGIGNDNLYGDRGNDTYIFKRGYGHDIIIDAYMPGTSPSFSYDAGIDIVDLKELNLSDVIFMQNDNDLIIGIKEGGKTFEELNDKLTIKYWNDTRTSIETFKFSDGTIFNQDEIRNIMITTNNDIISTHSGDDILFGGNGNDTLKGSSGNDTYIYDIGDGIDTIYDVSGIDTIKFNEGISLDNLIVKAVDENLIVAIKENGKSFDDLSNKIILENWSRSTVNKIEFFDATVSDVESLQVITTGDDYLTYYHGNNSIDALDGNDTIITGNGNDLLKGDQGNDILNGGSGDDRYIYNLGDGIDTIVDNQGTDTIILGDQINADNLIVKGLDGDIILGVSEIGKTFDDLSNKIILENGLNNSVKYLQFIDGTKIYIQSLQSITDNDDFLIYSQGDNVIDALEGNDTIVLGNGNDTITGNIGDDTIIGGYGSDTYIYNLGDGIDTIEDTNGEDKILFGENITLNDIIVQTNGDDMNISIQNNGKIILKKWMNNSVNTIQLTDGTTHDIGFLQKVTNSDDILSYYSTEDITIDALAGDDIITVGKGNDTVYGNDGNDTIINEKYIYYDTYSTNYGNDIFYGENGDDILIGAAGDDVLDGGFGNDSLEGSSGDDTYIFGQGYGQDTIKDEVHFFYGDFKQYYAGNDTIEFKDNTTMNDLLIQTDETNLIIAIKEDGKTFDELSDKLTITNWQNFNFRVENIKFSDGTLLTFTDSQANYTITPSIENSTPPIVLDMNLNGSTSISLNDSNAYFDYAGDGQKEHTSWIEEGDALLVADLNNDGKINDGSELFGNYTKLEDGTLATDGYNALAQYDSNSDGIINYKDSNFSKLSLWSDSNQNAKTDDGELINIQLSKITAIHLVNDGSTIFEQVTENGNIITNETIYETNFENGLVRDIWFQYDKTDYITNNDTLQASITQKYLSLNDGDDTYIYSLGDGLVTIDDNGDGNDTLQFTQDITKEQIEVKWDKNSDNLILAIRPTIDDTTTVTELENQILIKDWFTESGSIETISFNNGTSLNKEELFELLTSKKESSSISTRVLEENSELNGGDFNDLLYGSIGNELLNGNSGHDYIKGLEGDDHLIGGEGDDTINGGTGDDLSTDIQGDEYYIYNRGDGQDIIIDADGNDLVVFGPDISLEDLIIESSGDNLIMGLKEESKGINELKDSITIENYFLEDIYKIENIEFYNGTTLNLNEHLNTNTEISIDDFELTLQEDENISGAIDIQGNSEETLFTIETISENSNLTIDESGNYTYIPNENYNGIEVITIKVTNKYGDTSSATLTFNVESVNDTPTANEDSAELSENATLTINAADILSNDTDVDINDILSITNISSPLNKGTASLDSNGNVIFDTGSDFDYLALGETEQVTLNYEIQDDKGASSNSTISLTITGSNDAPVIDTIQGINTPEDSGILTGQINATDLDNNPTLSFSTTKVIAGFNLNSDGSYSFDPSNTEYQSLSEGGIKDIIIPVSVTDEHGSSDTKDLAIRVTGTNDSPIANEDTAQLLENATLTINAADILSNDTDVDTNDVLSITNVSSPLNKGTASLDSYGNVIFDTGSDFDYLASGEAEVITLNYEIQDDKGASSNSTISLTITGSNNIPIVTPASEEIILTQELVKEGQINATDIDGDTLEYSILTASQHGNLTVNQNGNWKYNVDPTYKGNDSAIILIDDGNGGTITKTLNFNIQNDPINGNQYSNLLFGDQNKNIINGLGGNDYIYAFNDDDIIFGGNGKDEIFGYAGDDNITGGKGNDYLRGSVGSDTYNFNLGDGKDVIVEYEYFYSNDMDKIVFGEGINSEEVKFVKDYYDLVVKVNDDDSIKIKNWYSYHDKNKIEEFVFNNGDTLSINDIEEKAIIEGTSYNDYLDGSYDNDKLYALEGNDKVYGYNGDDFINGGKGNDYLKGGKGDDTYNFSLGDGKDTILDKYKNWGWLENAGNDTISFNEGIDSSDILFKWDDNNLIINYSEEDNITIKSQKNEKKAIENFTLSDGSYLTNNDVENLIQNMISFAGENGIDMTNENEVRNNSELMNIVSNSWHSQT